MSKMKFSRFLAGYILVSLITTKALQAQEIKIGMDLPDVTLPNTLNYKTSNLKTSDFIGKVVIFDFWNISCTSCIAAFPKMEALQEKYKDSIQVLLVNFESSNVTRQFFANHKKIKKPDLPLVTGDTILSKMFPHSGFPAHVWISKQGKVIAITEGGYANDDNVQLAIQGKKLDLPEQIDFDTEGRPLLSLDSGRYAKYVAYYSCLVHYQPGLDVGNLTMSTTGTGSPNKITRNGADIIGLYREAYGESRYYFNYANSVELRVRDKSQYLGPDGETGLTRWRKENLYSYELTLPPSRAKDLYHIMQQDMIRFFGASGSVIKKKIKCQVLVLTGKEKQLKPRPDGNLHTDDSISTEYILFTDFEKLSERISNLFKANSNRISTPFVDDTHYKGSVDIKLRKSALQNFYEMGSFTELKGELNCYGLDLIENEMMQDVLLIEEK